jgi:transcription antitermination factor NusG
MTKNISKSKKNWFAIYTKPRFEKKTNDLLLLKGIESYCPINRVKKKYSDRWKWVDEILFTSYLFIKISEKEISEVRLTPGVVNFVYIEKKPAIIPEKDIIKIKKFLNQYTNVTVESFLNQELAKGQKVKIDTGFFMDSIGTVTKVLKDNKVKVTINSLQINLVTVINKNDLIII